MTPKEDQEDGLILRGLQWLTFKLNILEPGATAPDWRCLIFIFTSSFAFNFSNLLVHPFLPAMIIHLGIPENEKGAYAGFMTCCIYMGLFFGSMFWGWLADTKGRKFALALSLGLLGLSNIVFGFSTNIQMALATRFVLGLFNGISTSCRSVLYDVSDNTNQAIGMLMLSLAWGLGSFSGSLTGGFLASPCSRWPDICDRDNIFQRFPFLLPCVMSGVVNITAAILIFFKFKETLIKLLPDQVIITESDDDDCETNTKNISVSIPSNQCHVVYQKRPSADNHVQYTLVQPMLSRSATSLNPDADMSMCLGKSALERRERLETSRANGQKHLPRSFTSEPELGLDFGNGTNRFELRNVESIEVTELPSSQIADLPSRYQRTRAYSEGDNSWNYTLNGSNFKLPGVTICAQRKHAILENSDRDTSIHNNQPLLVETYVEGEDHICECCDQCFKLSCCAACNNTSLHKLLRISDVWATSCLYLVLCIATIGVEDTFPVFVSTPTDSGGLGFSTSEIGMAFGFISVPLLLLQMKFYPFLVARLRIRKTCLLMALVCMIESQSLPMLKSLNNSTIWLWIALSVLLLTFRTATSSCFASVCLLINNSAPQEQAGKANGLSITLTSAGRAFAPVVSGALYSWSVTYGQFAGPPFDTAFTFFVFGSLYAVAVLQCMVLNRKLEKQKK